MSVLIMIAVQLALTPFWLNLNNLILPFGFLVVVILFLKNLWPKIFLLFSLALLVFSVPEKEKVHESISFGAGWRLSTDAYKSIVRADAETLASETEKFIRTYDYDNFAEAVKKSCHQTSEQDYEGKIEINFHGDFYGRVKKITVESNPKSKNLESCIRKQVNQISWPSNKNLRWAVFVTIMNLKIPKKINLNAPALKEEINKIEEKYRQEFTLFNFEECGVHLAKVEAPTVRVPIEVVYGVGGKINIIKSNYNNADLVQCVIDKSYKRMGKWENVPALSGITVTFSVDFK